MMGFREADSIICRKENHPVDLPVYTIHLFNYWDSNHFNYYYEGSFPTNNYQYSDPHLQTYALNTQKGC